MITKQLGQVRAITAGTPVSIYSPASGVRAFNMIMTVANNTISGDSFYIYQDDDGTTYDETTVLYQKVDIGAYSTVEIQIPPMTNSSGNIACDVATTNAITFTLRGTEELIRTRGILGQEELTSAGTPELLYTCPSNVEASELICTVCNHTGTARYYEISQDIDAGSGHDDDTLIYHGVVGGGSEAQPGETHRVFLHPMSNGETVYVDAGGATALTFTLSGVERLIA